MSNIQLKNSARIQRRWRRRIYRSNLALWTFCKTSLTIICASAVITTSAVAQEKKLTKEQLPAAVQKTVDQQSKGATVVGFSSEGKVAKLSMKPNST